jgi:hypothetical protein
LGLRRRRSWSGGPRRRRGGILPSQMRLLLEIPPGCRNA